MVMTETKRRAKYRASGAINGNFLFGPRQKEFRLSCSARGPQASRNRMQGPVQFLPTYSFLMPCLSIWRSDKFIANRTFLSNRYLSLATNFTYVSPGESPFSLT